MPRYRNKITGEIIEVPDGPQMPANPTFPLQAPKMQADIGNTQASTVRTQVQTTGDTLDNETKAKNLRQNPLSEFDQRFINSLRERVGDMPGVLKDITAAQSAVDRFQPFPGKGLAYGMGTIDDDDGAVRAAMKWPVDKVLDDRSQEDYQTLLGLQNQSVLNAQLAQKGPQTESDAIRMKLAGVSPNKSVQPNARLLAEQQYDATMKMEMPAFYTYWANQLGSTQALNSKGQSADKVWAEQYKRGLQRMRNDPRYQGRSVRSAPRKQNRVIDWNDY